ncbi:MAG: hypothetical protein AAB490_01665 [Patescibacteria group bacterium]
MKWILGSVIVIGIIAVLVAPSFLTTLDRTIHVPQDTEQVIDDSYIVPDYTGTRISCDCSTACPGDYA